jgi:hypothetical protein
LKNRKIITAALCAMLCLAVLTGCGRSLIITTGFGRGDIFRIGSQSCKISEVRVYMLNLQKENERLFGNAIWESESSADLQEAVREQALAQVTRVKALNQLAVERNVMLTDTETGLAQQAEHDYYAGLSEEEIKYIDLDERNLQRMFCEYALADKTWTSLGDAAVETYEAFYKKTQCDLNTKYWQTVKLKKIDGKTDVPGFADCYKAVFGTGREDGAQDSTQDSTQEAASEEE